MTDSMILRVARAISPDWQSMAPNNRANAVITAKAAIAAMREPTRGMVVAGECEIYEHMAEPADWTVQSTIDGWRAMVDAALAEPQT